MLSKDNKAAALDVQWDPLSPMYLLAAYSDGSSTHHVAVCVCVHTFVLCVCLLCVTGVVTLFDVESRAELHSFDKQATGMSVRYA